MDFETRPTEAGPARAPLNIFHKRNIYAGARMWQHTMSSNVWRHPSFRISPALARGRPLQGITSCRVPPRPPAARAAIEPATSGEESTCLPTTQTKTRRSATGDRVHSWGVTRAAASGRCAPTLRWRTELLNILMGFSENAGVVERPTTIGAGCPSTRTPPTLYVLTTITLVYGLTYTRRQSSQKVSNT